MYDFEYHGGGENPHNLEEGEGEMHGVAFDNMMNAGAIRLPPATGEVVFQVTGTMLHLLQIKGFFGGSAYEDPYNHIQNVVEVCSLFTNKDMSQESVRLRLFPFSLIGEGTKWLASLPLNTITS